MKIIKILFFAVFLALLVFLSGYFFARPQLEAYGAPIFTKAGISLSAIDDFFIKTGVSNQVALLQEKSFQDGEVLGDFITENTDQPPAHERAFTYAQYMYCKQVIQEYEAQEEKNQESSEF